MNKHISDVASNYTGCICQLHAMHNYIFQETTIVCMHEGILTGMCVTGSRRVYAVSHYNTVTIYLVTIAYQNDRLGTIADTG